MRWWIVGGVAVVAALAALAVPWVPAPAVSTLPIEREWTITDSQSGYCVQVGFSSTLEGTERRPVMPALPWRAWSDVALAGDTVASVHVDEGCTGTGELAALDAGIVLGDAACGDWDFEAPMMSTTLAEVTPGCGGTSLRFDVGNLDAAAGMESHYEGSPWWRIGRGGCIELIAWADISWRDGDAGRSGGGGLPEPEELCLSESA